MRSGDARPYASRCTTAGPPASADCSITAPTRTENLRTPGGVAALGQLVLPGLGLAVVMDSVDQAGDVLLGADDEPHELVGHAELVAALADEDLVVVEEVVAQLGAVDPGGELDQ